MKKLLLVAFLFVSVVALGADSVAKKSYVNTRLQGQMLPSTLCETGDYLSFVKGSDSRGYWVCTGASEAPAFSEINVDEITSPAATDITLRPVAGNGVSIYTTSGSSAGVLMELGDFGFDAHATLAATDVAFYFGGKGTGDFQARAGSGGFHLYAAAGVTNMPITLDSAGSGDIKLQAGATGDILIDASDTTTNKVEIYGGATGGVKIHELTVTGHQISSADSIMIDAVNGVSISQENGSGDLDVSNDLSVGGDATITGNLTIGGTLTYALSRVEWLPGLVNTNYAVVDDFEASAGWADDGDNLTVTLDNGVFKKGAGSLKIASDGLGETREKVSHAKTNETWSGEYVGLWVRSSTALDAVDLELYVNDNGVDQWVVFPTAIPANTWVYERISIGGITTTDVDAWGVAVTATGKVKVFDLYVDNGIRYDASGLVTLKQIPRSFTGVYATPIATPGVFTEKVEDTNFWVDYTNKQLIFVADEQLNVWNINYTY